jgi:hypothetical protein
MYQLNIYPYYVLINTHVSMYQIHTSICDKYTYPYVPIIHIHMYEIHISICVPLLHNRMSVKETKQVQTSLKDKTLKKKTLWPKQILTFSLQSQLCHITSCAEETFFFNQFFPLNIIRTCRYSNMRACKILYERVNIQTCVLGSKPILNIIRTCRYSNMRAWFQANIKYYTNVSIFKHACLVPSQCLD